MTRDQYRRAWLRYHRGYERRGVKIFRKALQEMALQVPYKDLSEMLYPTTVEMNVTAEDAEKAYLQFYTQIGLIHGNRVGKNINKQLKAFEPGFFDNQFKSGIHQWLIDNAGLRIVSVRRGLIDYLIAFIGEKVDEGLTMQEIARQVQRHILSRGFYRWQIERIVRTETTAAANYGAIRAGDVSGVLMVKEWVSSHDARTRQHERGDRFDHWDMDGERVAKDEDFQVQDRLSGLPDSIAFPGDPKGQAGNVINCRCTAGLTPQRDAQGDLIFT